VRRKIAPPTVSPVEEYFGFIKMPFSRNLAPEDLMPLEGQQEMLARCRLAVRDQSIALMTGQGGCGKSTTLRQFRDSLDPNRFIVLEITNPASGLTGAYRDMVRKLGQDPSYFTPHLVSQLREALERQALRERRAVIMADEGHRFTDTWLESLRMIVSSDLDATSLATLVLSGDLTLSQRLRMEHHESLWGRINYRYQLKPLDLAQTIAYVQHHLKVAGYRGDGLFSEGFLVRLREYTGGVLRRINQACTYALVAALTRKVKVMDEAIFQQVQLDLDQDL
jgi:type II secretory pathway predicted ATPase ExeA